MMKRVLILANCCLSKSDSNGRTLSNMLTGYPKELLAQFTLQENDPDFDRCDRYFCVSDGEALRAFLRRGKAGHRLYPKEKPATAGAGGKGVARTPLTMLLRDLIWSVGPWKKDGFWQFVEDFDPEVILLQAGDAPFMYRLGVELSKGYGIPLVMYNSEDYYFKEYDYFRSRGAAHLLYPLFRRRLRKSFRKAMKQTSQVIYNCEPLQRAYEEEFSVPSAAVYTATHMKPEPARKAGAGYTVSYLGNLGVGRHEALTEIADTLQELSEDLHLDVYGKIPGPAVEEAFRACPGIRYQGFVSYEEVESIMRSSDLLVHGECFDPFYRRDLKYAFSTKIADSLGLAKDFLLYAPEELAETQYLLSRQGAYTATDRGELKRILQNLVRNPEARGAHREHALRLAEENHRPERCASRFRQLLNEAKTI